MPVARSFSWESVRLSFPFSPIAKEPTVRLESVMLTLPVTVTSVPASAVKVEPFAHRQVELVVMDANGRLQVPHDVLESIGLHGKSRVHVEAEDGKIVIRPGEKKEKKELWKINLRFFTRKRGKTSPKYHGTFTRARR